MTKQEKADDIAQMLEGYYPEVPIPLDHKDPYTLLVAVLLSAQCTDERVNKVTPYLWELADNPHDMSQQAVGDIKAIIRPCGLSPRKSQAIYDLSHIILEEHDGQVPQSFCLLYTSPSPRDLSTSRMPSSA